MVTKKLIIWTVTVLLLLQLKSASGIPSWSGGSGSTQEVCESLEAGEYAYTMSATGTDVEYCIENQDSVDFEMCDGTSKCPSKTTNGSVCAKKKLDRETVSSYTLTEVASERGSLIEVQQSTTVSLLDANDNSPVFENLPYTYSFPEGTLANTIIGVVSASDIDNQYAGAVTLSLSDDKGMIRLEMANTIPVNLTTTAELDFEESPIYIGRLTAKDLGETAVGCGSKSSRSSDTNVFLNVIDGPDTAPIFSRPQYSAELPENTDQLQPQLIIQARDGDYDLNWDVTYKLVDDDDIFQINSLSGEITVKDKTKVDRESKRAAQGFYTLTVKAIEMEDDNYDSNLFTDTLKFPGAQNTTVDVTINIIDANDNQPKFYSDSDFQTETTSFSTSVPESTRGLVPEFRIYVKDADQTDNAVFNLTIVGADAKYFELSETEVQSQSSLSLQIVEQLDYERQTTLECEIRAEEGDKTTIASLIIEVTDENDNRPEFETSSLEVSIYEHASIGSLVTIINATDADSEKNGEFEFTLQPSNSGFDIDNSTGEVFVTDADLDREQRADYFLTILATDTGGLVNTMQLTVSLKDINDQEPQFLQDEYLINWNENEENPDAIAVRARDGDDPQSINSAMEIFFADTDLSEQFNITQTGTNEDVTGAIIPTGVLDAEGLEADCSNGIIQFQFKVYVRDEGTPPLNSSADVTVFFRDVNDNSPVFNQTIYYGSVPEESVFETPIVPVFATDDDKCEANNDITFSIDAEYAGLFLMGPSENGAATLKVRGYLDRNQQETYNITVNAIDNGLPRLSGTATIEVTITDINNKDPIFNQTNVNRVGVNETTIEGTEIASIFAYDPDLDSNLKFAITEFQYIDENGKDADPSPSSDWFNITTVFEEGVVSVASELDRETAATVVLTVEVEDLNAVAKNGRQTATTTLTIDIIDYNDNAPVIEDPAKPFEVIEESDNGTVIGTLSASDKDENNIVTFSTISSYIAISPEGQITYQGRVDREGDPGDNFTAEIFATDNVPPKRTSSIIVHFNVIDLNDNDPTFANSSYACNITEHRPKDTEVCQIVATDRDAGDNGIVVYSLLETTDFLIDSTTGVIRSDKEFDQEHTNTYQFRLRGRDSAGDVFRQSIVDVTVTILDIDDNDPTYKGISDQEIQITEENEPNFPMGFVTEAEDLDTEANQNNYYFLVYDVNDDLSDKFSLSKTTRELSALQTLDREAISAYTLYVLTTKNDSISSTNRNDYVADHILTVNVQVKDINDNSPKFERRSDTTDLLYQASYGENNIVSIVNADDPDEGSNATVIYSILSEEYFPPGSQSSEPLTGGAFFEIGKTNGQVQTTTRNFESVVAVESFFRLRIEARDGGDLTDDMTLDIKIFDETESVILTSRQSEEYLDANRDKLEKDLEAALNADVVIDKIVAQESTVVTQSSRATEDQTSTLTDIYFHATEWNETALIPADEIAAELDSSANNQLLIDYAIVSIGTTEPENPNKTSQTDLLKAVLAIVSAVLILFLVVLAIAFVCMRRSYKTKLKAASASLDAIDVTHTVKTSGGTNVPTANKTPENPLFGMQEIDKIGETSDDNNSIDDNAVDSHDSAFSGDRQGSLKDDDLDDVDIDYETGGSDLANLQSALNRKGNSGDMYFYDNYAADNTAM